MGSRHRDEAFGDPFELPPDRAYAETCAAIASVMLAWRLLLATGRAPATPTPSSGPCTTASCPGSRSTAPGSSTSTRCSGAPAGPQPRRRTASAPPWYPCACCPPNLMRTARAPGSSTWRRRTTAGVQLHQYASARDPGRAAGRRRAPRGRDRLSVGRPRTVCDPRGAGRTRGRLSLRVPGLVPGRRPSTGPDGTHAKLAAGTGQQGDGPARRGHGRPATPSCSTSTCPRVTEPDPRVDAVRGCVAVERGPLVYCIESADLPRRRRARGRWRWDPRREPGAGATAGPRARRRRLVTPAAVDRAAARLTLAAVPYFAWANRASAAMRVWIPAADRPTEGSGRDRAQPAFGGAVESRTISAARTGQLARRRAGIRVAGERDRPGDGRADDLGDRHPQRRQRRHGVRGDQDVVEADHRQPVGHGRAEAVRRVQGTRPRRGRSSVATAVGGSGRPIRRAQRGVAAGQRVRGSAGGSRRGRRRTARA